MTKVHGRPPAPAPQRPDQGWTRDTAITATTIVAAAGGTLLGTDLGVAALIDHVATVSQGQGLMALLTFPAELVRGVFTHVLPLAVGTGTVTGVVGYAIGKEAFKGAPLKDDSTPKERSPSLDP